MSNRVSALSNARKARAAEREQVRDAKALASSAAGPAFKKLTMDSYQNFGAKLGVGTGNITDGGTYGFNPITRIRTLLEWIHRGSWIGGLAVDIIPDDMTRGGVDLLGEVKPADAERIEETITSLNVWDSLNEVAKWSRLYGGAIGVLMVKGQDYSTPLRVDTVGKGMFRGVLPLDRWMVDPSLDDLVQEEGPHIGKPKFYRINEMAPALRRNRVHYTRVIRMAGIRLPGQQSLTENGWGISVIERLYDRLLAFDSATAGAAQLVYKSYIRTYGIKDLRTIVAAGGDELDGLTKYIEMMRIFQGIEGITLMDAEDTFTPLSNVSFAGLSESLVHFGQQISGSLQIPLVRLFGQSPAGLNSSGESDMRTYYDGILQQQKLHFQVPVAAIYRMASLSEGIRPPQGFGISFRSLWQPNDKEKTEMATADTQRVSSAVDSGIVTAGAGIRELRARAKNTGAWASLTDEDVKAAEMVEDVPEPEKVRAAEMGGGDEEEEQVEQGQEPGTAERGSR